MNSWDDWRLIPSSKPTIALPALRSKWVEIPGADGQIELNKRINGLPLYENRTGSLEFVVADFMGRNPSDLYSEIAMHLHGMPMTLLLEDEPGYYYEGLLTLDNVKSTNNFPTISIGYTLYPYKFEIDSSFADWDPLDYEMGHVNEIDSFYIDGSSSKSITVNRDAVCPALYCTSAMTLTSENKTYKLPRGYTRNKEIILRKGRRNITFSGTGMVMIDYRGGVL